jgi:hypothetical protein
MNNRKQLLVEVAGVLANLVRTIHLRRAMNTVSPNPHLSFWRVIHDNLADIAALEWCKLFSPDDGQYQASMCPHFPPGPLSTFPLIW